ncbi:MAG TPA: hypothetical protein VI385_12780 [Flavisolibacter sp.]
MNQDRDQQQQTQPGAGRSNDSKHGQKHSSPFKETTADIDNTENSTQEEANLEQERKEAMTERD